MLTSLLLIRPFAQQESGKEAEISGSTDFFWPMTITARIEQYPPRSQMALSLHCPKEADLGRHPARDCILCVAYEHLLMLENTDINRKAKQVERILSRRVSELTFAKIIHLVGMYI